MFSADINVSFGVTYLYPKPRKWPSLLIWFQPKAATSFGYRYNMSSETNDFSITKWKKNHNSLHAVEIAAYYFLMDFYNSAAFAVWVQIKRTIRQSTALQNNPKKFEKRSFYNKLRSTYTFWILNILHFLLKTLLQLYTAFARVTFRTRTWNSRENLV